jgi:hypothetical protein
MIAAFRSCPIKFWREFCLHYKPRAPSVHLVAGGAFARGIEIARRSFYEDGASAEDAIARGLVALIQAYGDFECPPDSAKSLERTCGAFEFYFSNYPLGNDGSEPVLWGDGKRMIEFSFAETLPILHPDTGDPLLYCGRSDMIAHFAGGTYIFDEKTTSSLGPSWGNQWDLRSQFTGYCWAAERAQIPVNGVVVRGVSILKTKYDTQQVITSRADWEIQRWYEQLLFDISRMVDCYRTGYWDYNLDHACTEYGGCLFKQPCKSPDPQPWLDLYFERRVWDPLAREETKCES